MPQPPMPPVAAAATPPDFRSIGEITAAAEAVLAPELRDYLLGGAATETTMRRNREALAAATLLPRVLRDVAEVDTSVDLFGQPMALPVFNAPIGSLDLLHPDGALGSADGAAEAGSLACVSLLSRPGFEHIARQASRPPMLQLYIRGDMPWLADIVRRAEAAGCPALVLTADTAVYGRRDRDIARRYSARRAVDKLTPSDGADASGRAFQARFTWESFERLRGMTRLPIAIKGIMTADDAKLAVRHGADAVYVSNHGGRQLDNAPATIDVLPGIVAAVAGRAPVLVDGGIMRGTDIITALALGARAVGIGKLQGMALAAGGRSGVVQLLGVLAAEMRSAMALMGATRVADLGAHCLWRP